jgi:hypothetical protein
MADNTRTITIREFRCWLQGVEEMQEPDWVPTATQWERIRAKIDSISEETVTVREQAPLRLATPGLPNVASVPITPPAQVVPAGPSSLAVPAPRPVGPANPLLGQGNGKVKTPDIDTSGKPYESGFV